MSVTVRHFLRDVNWPAGTVQVSVSTINVLADRKIFTNEDVSISSPRIAEAAAALEAAIIDELGAAPTPRVPA